MNQQGQQSDYAQSMTAGGSIGGGYDYDQQRKLQQQLEALQERQKAAMTTKLNKVAELFELDVLSEDEALKACKVIIGQHAKVKGKTASGENVVNNT